MQNALAETVKDVAEAAYYTVIDTVVNHVPELWADPLYKRVAYAAGGCAIAGAAVFLAYKKGIFSEAS